MIEITITKILVITIIRIVMVWVRLQIAFFDRLFSLLSESLSEITAPRGDAYEEDKYKGDREEFLISEQR